MAATGNIQMLQARSFTCILSYIRRILNDPAKIYVRMIRPRIANVII